MLTLRGDLWLEGCIGRAGRGPYVNIGEEGNPGGDLNGDFFCRESLEDILGDGDSDTEELEGEALLAFFFFLGLGVVGSESG